MARNYVSLFLLGAMVCVLLTGHVEAVDHIVGGSFGWTIPKNASYYNDWAKSRTFYVGDKLVFLFRTGMHNVVETGQKAFEGCTQDKTINMYNEGPTLVEITEAGEHYYLCSFGSHCAAGQKLSITAVADPNQKTSSSTSIRNFGAVAGLLSLLATLFI